MKHILSYLKSYKAEAIIAPLFKMLEASFELIIPLIVADMIDNGIPAGDKTYLVGRFSLMVLFGVIGLSVSLIAQYSAAKAALGCGTAMRRELFQHILAMSHREIDQAGTSTLITRMTSDINQVQNGVNMFLRLLLRSPFVVLGAMVMALRIHLKSGLIFVVLIPILFLIIWAILNGTMPLYRKVQSKLDKVVLNARENLTGVRVVRAFHHEEKEKEMFQKNSETLYKNQIFVGKISAIMNPATYALVNCGIICILYYGGHQVDAGILSRGQIVALVNYMSQILIELVKLANLIILLSRSVASLKRVEQVFAMNEPLANGIKSYTAKAPDAPFLQFQDVSFSYYKGGAPALSGISFTIRGEKTIGIIGGTGSGKSSLVRLIPRFYDPSEGAVHLYGTDLKELDYQELRHHIGMVPQKASLVKGTIRSNLNWGCRSASDEVLWRALETAQAKDFVAALSDGLDAPVEQGGLNFSGGQRQRLTIARALTGDPDILILDDSASALDYATDLHLRQAIRNSLAETKVFIVSQRVSAVRNADLILLLDRGKLIDTGTHSQLFASSQLYREICLSQNISK